MVLPGCVIVVKLPEIDVVTVEAGKIDVVVKKRVKPGKLVDSHVGSNTTELTTNLRRCFVMSALIFIYRYKE